MFPKIVRRMCKSIYVTLPPKICKETGIAEGSFVNMDREGNKVVITPVEAAVAKPEPETGVIGAPVKEAP